MTDLERDLRDMMNRTADDVHHVPRPSPGLVRRARLRRARTAVLAGAASLALVIGGFAGARSLSSDDALPPANPDSKERAFERRMPIIRQVVDAINTRDTNAFIGAFTPRGDFNPRGDFDGQSGMFGMTLPVAQAQLVQAWMDIVEAWGLEADLGGCAWVTEDEFSNRYRLNNGSSDAFAVCDVTTRWHTLSLEIVERWTFEFEGRNVVAWEHWLFDLNPSASTLPLGYDGLLAWEAWLEANHPDDAAQYLNPRNPGPEGDDLRSGAAGKLLRGTERAWVINGHEFSPNAFIPYDPAFADEIEASIQDYLDRR